VVGGGGGGGGAISSDHYKMALQNRKTLVQDRDKICFKEVY
jgi:hypothetical protein